MLSFVVWTILRRSNPSSEYLVYGLRNPQSSGKETLISSIFVFVERKKCKSHVHSTLSIVITGSTQTSGSMDPRRILSFFILLTLIIDLSERNIRELWIVYVNRMRDSGRSMHSGNGDEEWKDRYSIATRRSTVFQRVQSFLGEDWTLDLPMIRQQSWRCISMTPESYSMRSFIELT